MFLNNYNKNTRGFTLVEMLVSVSLFSIVMLVATSTVFSIVEANKKTNSIKSVMTNLNFTLESMVRDIRVGTNYSCIINNGPVGDCTGNAGTGFSFKANRDVDGDGLLNDLVTYSFDNSTGRIKRKVDGNSYPSDVFLTAAEITVTRFNFYVIGTGSGSLKQPKVVMIIQGYAGSGTTKSNFNIQTTVSQRALTPP